MSRLAVLLCMISVATVQVPLITCTSDCHEVVFAGVAEHECHGGCARAVHHAHVGCHGSDCSHDEEREPPATEHDVIQLSVLRAGAPVELPAAHPVGSATLVSMPDAAVAVPARGRGEPASDDTEPDGPPDDLLGTVHLLL